MNARLLAVLLPLAVALPAAAAPADTTAQHGGLTILGNSQARLCASHARLAADHKMSPEFALETCSEALNIELLSLGDRAATHNNRGIVRLTMAEEAPVAIEDFNEAARLVPSLGETYVNQGSVLMREMKFAEAKAKFDQSIELGVEEPWKAYFNRALAREFLDDLPGAYADFMKAQELKPDWPLPAVELARYSVRTR